MVVDLSRVANNALAVAVIGGFFYIIYEHFMGNNVLAKFKDKMGKFKGRGGL